MDLISREAAIEALGERPMNWTDTPEEIEAIVSWHFAVNAINSVPSVPAVPLDKLCELLSKGAYPCTILSASLCPFEECIATSRYSNNVSKDCWRAVLTKWMEEQDADRQ